jgi:hypothetical protein
MIQVPHRMTIGPVNRCIYCNATGVPLTDEHIVPKGIGGRLELLLYSCVRCQTKIQPVEDELMNFPFQAARRAHNLLGQGKRDRPITLQHKSTGQKLEIPVADFPVYYPLVKFLPGPPRMFGGQHRNWPLLCDYQVIYADLAKDRDAKLAKLGLSLPDILYLPKSTLFVRLLAKIAHAYACAMHFQGQQPDFQPYLHRLARGDTKLSGATLIGNAPAPLHARHKGPGHITELSVLPFNQAEYLVCQIRLFGSITQWVYLAVVGKVRKPALLTPRPRDAPA